MAPTPLSLKTRWGGGGLGGVAYKDRARPPPPVGLQLQLAVPIGLSPLTLALSLNPLDDGAHRPVTTLCALSPCLECPMRHSQHAITQEQLFPLVAPRCNTIGPFLQVSAVWREIDPRDRTCQRSKGGN